MRIANVMFGRELGGIEQAFLDYNEALTLAGHEVLAITHPLAQINPHITGDVQYRSLNNLGKWDFSSALKLKKMLKEFKPDATITHGNRALILTRKAKKHAGLHIGITHNYNLKHFDKLDLIFAITKDLRSAAASTGIPLTHIIRIPNMVRLPEHISNRAEKSPNAPIVIGAMGRMVSKKGFDHLIDAASRIEVLTRLPFKIIIGGEGDEKAALKRRVKKHKLQDKVEFAGWIDNKETFFAQCDIFCLPSIHEPFGIVLLEAMSYGVPIVAYGSEGPSDIFAEHPDAGILVPNGDVGALADSLSQLMANPTQREFLGKQARIAVEYNFSIPIISKKIDAALNRYIHP